MTRDEELMQQALDALDIVKLRYTQNRHVNDAIAALRERLAQPEMPSCAGRNCGSTNPNLHSAECFEDYEKTTGMNQRKPLSDEEIAECVSGIFAERNYWVKFARAIERAHGIGE